VISIFESHNFKVLEEKERIQIHGTDIRKMMEEGKWEEVGKRTNVERLKDERIKKLKD